MAKTTKKEVERPLDSNNTRDRETFREKLIQKLKLSKHASTLTQLQLDELVNRLTSVKHIRTTDLNHNSRQIKLQRLADTAKELIKNIESLSVTEKLIIEDDLQHNLSLNCISEIIKPFSTKVDHLANVMPKNKHNNSTKLIRYLNGKIFLNILDDYSIPPTPNHSTQGKDEAIKTNKEGEITHRYLPDLSINPTTAMLCAMLNLLDSEEEDLSWNKTNLIIDSAIEIQEASEEFPREATPEKLKEKLSDILEEINRLSTL